MSGPCRRFKRAISSVLATMMVATCLPFSAVAGAAASTPSAPRAAYADFRRTGPVGTRKAPEKAATKVNVRWRKGVPATQIAAAAKQLGFTVLGTSTLGWVQLAPAKRMTAGALATTLRTSGLTTEARTAVTYQAAAVPANVPNDPLFSGQYGLYNTGQTGGTPGADIKAATAWASTTGSKNVIVAVVDEGVNVSHPDLKNNIWINTDEVPNNGVDDDNNGYVDDVRGYDFYNYDETVYDSIDGDRHGTHVAGIIGAQGNNGIGVSGVNWNVSIMPLKFLGPYGGDDFAGAEAITYAVDNGARVINCSWGGEGQSPVLEEAIAYANDHGVLIAAAAGNDGMSVDSNEYWPASSSSPNVITVAATDDRDQLADFSNFGANTVDIAAPGVDVTSTLPAESAGVFVDYIDAKTAYQVMYLPIQVESFEPASARDAIIARSVTRLGAVADTDILLVDDSNHTATGDVDGVRRDIYLNALSDAGFNNVTTWVVESKGAPTQAAMQGRLVVWFTGRDSAGWYGDYCINKAEQAAIATYLDNGGHLLMASGEMATDLEYWGGQYPDEFTGEIDEPFFLQKYFHVLFADINDWTLTFSGKEGTPLAGLTASLPDTYQTDDFLWPTGSDSIVPLFDMPYLGGAGPAFGEGELPDYGGATDETIAPEPTRESVHTQMQVGKYGPLSGTSMATPMVSGALALLMAKYPTATSEEIGARILNTTDQLPRLDGKTVFGGRLNLLSAMSSYPGRPTITGPSNKKTLLAGTESTVTWTPAIGGDPSATFEAQLGLPYTEWTTGFEDSTLGDFSAVDTTTPWEVSSAPEDVFSGGFGARSGIVHSAVDLGDGWTEGSVSAMTTTVTVPAGGGTLNFSWRATVGDNQVAEYYVDNGSEYDSAWESIDWTDKTVELTAGQHTITYLYVNFDMEPTAPELHAAVDDLELIAHQFTPLGTAPAGSTALGFTVPTTDTSDAWVRVRARNGIDSAWAYNRGLKFSTDGVAPGSPTGFSATAMGDGVVDLGWTKPADADFSATRVLVREGTMPTGPEDASATVSYEGTGTAATVSGLKDGTTLCVAAYAMDESGNFSEPAMASVDVVDVTPPSAVKFLQARMVSGGVGVSWMSPTPESFASISVLRRTDTTPTAGDAQATEVFSGNGCTASDWTLPDTAYKAYYTVYATDASGNRSAPVSVRINPDLTAPEGELLLNDGESFTGNVNVSVTSAVTGATEMRIFTNGEYDPEALWVPFDSSTMVTLLPIDGWQSVDAEYRDVAGNYFSTTAQIYVDLKAPLAPTGVTAENWNVGVRLSWDDPYAQDPADESVVDYRIWQATSPTGPWTLLDTSETGADPSGFYVGGLDLEQTYYFKIAAVDGVGHVGPQSAVVSSTVGTGVVRHVGANRYETAAMASAAHFQHAETVVLVSGTAYADALGASPLAGVLDGPVLLTSRDGLDASSAAEIDRLGATDVVVVGGEGSVSPAVVAELEDRGLGVTRIGGEDRYEVAGRVATKVVELASAIEPPADEVVVDIGAMTDVEFLQYLIDLLTGGPETSGGWDGTVVVANGTAVADAMAVGPMTYASHTPVVLVRSANVPEATQNSLSDIADLGGPVTRALVVGGAGSVPEAVAVQVSPEWRRLGGATRYDVALSVADYAVAEGILSWQRIGVASGTAYADGLAAGPALGAVGGILLLTPADHVPAATLAAMDEHNAEIGMAEIFGGPATLSEDVAQEVQDAITHNVY